MQAFEKSKNVSWNIINIFLVRLNDTSNWIGDPLIFKFVILELWIIYEVDKKKTINLLSRQPSQEGKMEKWEKDRAHEQHLRRQLVVSVQIPPSGIARMWCHNSRHTKYVVVEKPTQSIQGWSASRYGKITSINTS